MATVTAPESPLPAAERIQTEAIRAFSPRRAENRFAAQTIRERINQENNRQSVVDMRAGITLGVDDMRRDQILERNVFIDTTLPPGDPTRSSQELRHSIAQDEIDNLNTLVRSGDRGLASLRGPDQVAIRGQVLSRLDSLAPLTQMMGGLEEAADRDAFVDSLFSDGAFRGELNKQLQDALAVDVNAETATRVAALPKFPKISDAAADARITTAGAETPPRTLTRPEARSEINTERRAMRQEAQRREVEASWMTRLQDVVDRAVTQHVANSFDRADEIVTRQGVDIDREAKERAAERGEELKSNVVDNFDKRWNNKRTGKNMAKGDFDAFVVGGLDALLKRDRTISVADRKLIMSDVGIKSKIEEHMITALLTKRLRRGRFQMDDYYSLADANWCGKEKVNRAIQNYITIATGARNDQDRQVLQTAFMQEMTRDWPESKKGKFIYGLLAGSIVGLPILAWLKTRDFGRPGLGSPPIVVDNSAAA